MLRSGPNGGRLSFLVRNHVDQKPEGPPPNSNIDPSPNPDPDPMDDFPEDCVPSDCDQDVVENCKVLWEEKLAECEEHKDDWAGFCPAPQYTDMDGNLRDCKRGCCSEAMEELHEEMHEEPCFMPCQACHDCNMNLVEEDWMHAEECYNHASESEQCQKCHECDWQTEGEKCEEKCEPCHEQYMQCDPCMQSCSPCHHCWEEVHEMHEPPPPEHELEEMPGSGSGDGSGSDHESPCMEPCSTCDTCWTDEKKQEEAHACYEEKAASDKCMECHSCDWADPAHCEEVCHPCWESEQECDACRDDCDACNGCWEMTSCADPPGNDDPCFEPCTDCDGCYMGMTEADHEEAGKCFEEKSGGEECKTCDACWMEGGSHEECEEKCEPCWHSYEECDKCKDSCGGCHDCWDNIHGAMEEMPMEEEYVEGPCDQPCSHCDECWHDPVSQDKASACFQEKESSDACQACHGADWSDMAAAEATCEPCWSSMEECDVCKDNCEACNHCWEEAMPSPEPPSMDEFPGTDGSMEGEPGHFCDHHGPEEFPCCAKQDRKEQDECLEHSGVAGGHFCDHHGPDEFPCCAKQDRKEQDECLQASGTVDTGAGDEVGSGGSSHTMEIDGAEYENPCQEPCFECDMCWQNESKQEDARMCYDEKASSPECMLCDSADWDADPAAAEETCQPCWDSYHACDACGGECHACNGCWEEAMPEQPADEAMEPENPCIDSCEPCDMCWTDPKSQEKAEKCHEKVSGSKACGKCDECDWENDGDKCEKICDKCWQKYEKCDVCKGDCDSCNTCWENVHPPDAAAEWEEMALAATSRKRGTAPFKPAETTQCKLQKEHVKKSSKVLKVLSKGLAAGSVAVRSEAKVARSLFHAKKGPSSMRRMLKALQKSKTQFVREEANFAARALVGKQASAKKAGLARALRLVAKAAKHSAKAKALQQKLQKAVRKTQKSGKAKSPKEAKKRVLAVLKRMRLSKSAKNAETRQKVLTVLFTHRKSSKSKRVPRFLYKYVKPQSKVQRSEAIKAINVEASGKASTVRMLYTLSRSSKAATKAYGDKMIRRLTHTKRMTVAQMAQREFHH
jgi:hypothetical protein